jgi:hypothetical protein
MKRQRGERAKSLAFTLALLFAFVSFTPVAKADSQTQTFKADLDFSVWSKDKTELVGSDGGVKLSTDPASSGFYQSGTLTYKFSPGGTNHWTSAASSVATVDSSQAWFAWEGQNKQNKVLQVDPVEGSTVKEWVTGTTPLAGVGGGSADYWVTNSVPYQTTGGYNCTVANRTAGLCYSVSHIMPSQNKIVTRPIPTASNRNLITISIDKVNKNLWIGDSVNKQIIVLNYTNFDDTAQALDYDTIEATYIPYKSVLSSGAQAFCFTSYEIGFECINTTDYEDIATPQEGAGEIFLDEHDDIWYTGTDDLYKARPDFTGGGHFDKQTFNNTVFGPDTTIPSWPATRYAKPLPYITELAVVPDSLDTTPDDGHSVIMFAKQSKPDLYYMEIQNNPLPSSSVLSSNSAQFKSLSGPLNTSSYNYRHALNISPNGDVVYMGTSIALDPDRTSYSDYLKNRFYDVAPKATSYAPVVQNLNDSQSYSTADQLEPYVYFDNFIASGVGSTDTAVVVKYSNTGAADSFQSAGTDGSIPVTDSADLYIQVTLSGFRSASPILKSLSITYQSSLADNLKTIVTRSMYKSEANRDDNTDPISTFEKGQPVYVRTKIYEPSLRRDDVKIEETVSGIDKFSILDEKKFVYKTGTGDKCTTVISDRTITPTTSGQTYIFTIPFITRGLTCIDYEYTSS